MQPPLEASPLWLAPLSLRDRLRALQVSRDWRTHATNPLLWRVLQLVYNRGGYRRPDFKWKWDDEEIPSFGNLSLGAAVKIRDEDIQRMLSFAAGQCVKLECSGLKNVTHSAFAILPLNRNLTAVTVTNCERVKAPVLAMLRGLPRLTTVRLMGCDLIELPRQIRGQCIASTDSRGDFSRSLQDLTEGGGTSTWRHAQNATARQQSRYHLGIRTRSATGTSRGRTAWRCATRCGRAPAAVGCAAGAPSTCTAQRRARLL